MTTAQGEERYDMYAVEVRDHVMIAHSFKGALFGPAQGLHGATFVVDVAFFREELTPDGVVVDIGRAHEALKATLAPLNYKNLDELPQFQGQNTTTEFLSRHIYEGMADAARGGRLGPGSNGVARIRVTLHESHVARAWFEGPVSA
jgi:6-pyruvoyl-tetrahydropterin synthase